MNKFKITINQNINGKEREVQVFEFLDRKMATSSFKSLQVTCKMMSEKHYTVMRLFKNDFELAKFSWEKGRMQSHSFKNDYINKSEVWN